MTEARPKNKNYRVHLHKNCKKPIFFFLVLNSVVGCGVGECDDKERTEAQILSGFVEVSGTIGVFNICNGYRANTCQPSCPLCVLVRFMWP